MKLNYKHTNNPVCLTNLLFFSFIYFKFSSCLYSISATNSTKSSSLNKQDSISLIENEHIYIYPPIYNFFLVFFVFSPLYRCVVLLLRYILKFCCVFSIYQIQDLDCYCTEKSKHYSSTTILFIGCSVFPLFFFFSLCLFHVCMFMLFRKTYIYECVCACLFFAFEQKKNKEKKTCLSFR